MSAFHRQTLTCVSGIVTAKRTVGSVNNANTGFYLQDPAPDADDATSEAIFVRTPAGAAPVNVGDAVTVLTGTVREWRPGCTSQSTWTDTCSPSDSGFNNLTLTWLVVASNGDITVTSTGNALPATIVIGTGGRVPPTTNVSSDVSNIDTATGATFNPASDGADFFESLEFMRVQVNDAVVVGPKTSNGEVGVLGDNGDNASGIRTPHGGILYSSYADDQPERIILDDQIIGFANMPAAHVGATMPLVVGVIDYSFGNVKLQVTTAPVMATNPLQRETTASPGAGELSVATFNVENLTDGDAQSKFNTLATLIVNNMKAPDLIVIEEIQDNNGTSGGTVASNEVWDKLIQTIQTVGGVTYQYRQIDPQDGTDGGAPGGNIRQGFLFRTDRGLAFMPRSNGGLDCSGTSPTPAGCATRWAPAPRRTRGR
jgi:predicted extracellular nuclease